MPRMTGPEILALLAHAMPSAHPDRITFDDVDPDAVRFRYRATQEDLRPGNTVAGPTLMALSDLGMYFAVLAARGPVLLAVTSSLDIHFLRKASAGELVVETHMLKLGKRLAVGKVLVRDAGGHSISHATVTYAIPAT